MCSLTLLNGVSGLGLRRGSVLLLQELSKLPIQTHHLLLPKT